MKLRDVVPSLVLLVVALMVVLVVSSTGTSTPYSIFNSGDEGYSKLLESVVSDVIDNITEDLVRSCDDSMIIMPLINKLDEENYKVLEEYLTCGGTVILLDENGYINDFLVQIGIEAFVDNHTVLDEIDKLHNRYYPIITFRTPNNTTMRIATYKPTSITIPPNTVGINIVPLGITSEYAYVDRNGDGYFSSDDRMGEQAIVVAVHVGKGLLYIVSDVDVLTNRLLDKLDNIKFIEYLTSNKNHVYLYIGALNMGILDEVRYYLMKLGLTGRQGGNIAVIELLLLLAMTMVVYSVEKRR